MYQVTYLNFLTPSIITAVEGGCESATVWPPFPLKWRFVSSQIIVSWCQTPSIYANYILRTILLGELKICIKKMFSLHSFF